MSDLYSINGRKLGAFPKMGKSPAHNFRKMQAWMMEEFAAEALYMQDQHNQQLRFYPQKKRGLSPADRDYINFYVFGHFSGVQPYNDVHNAMATDAEIAALLHVVETAEGVARAAVLRALRTLVYTRAIAERIWYLHQNPEPLQYVNQAPEKLTSSTPAAAGPDLGFRVYKCTDWSYQPNQNRLGVPL